MAPISLHATVSGAGWSASAQPGLDPGRSGASHKAVFSEHEAVFTHSAGSLTTQTEIVVSAEDDAEARRATLTNTGRTKREIDLTSCAELVLAPMAADVAHPAFSKLFVVTDFLPELGVLIATRRRCAPGDPEVWAAHIAVVEGTEVAAMGFETDRARFIGQDGSIRQAAMAGRRLSQTTGTVLDPVFAIRRSVLVPMGGARASPSGPWSRMIPTRFLIWSTVTATPLLSAVPRPCPGRRRRCSCAILA